jgi:hypothetical protein
MSSFLIRARRGLHLALKRPGEALLVGRMAACVASLSLLVKLLPLPRALTLLSPRGSRAFVKPQRVDDARMAQLLDALLGLNLLCFTPKCWKRAAVLHRQLTLRGRETRVLFGLRKEDGDLLAGHAWIESGGQPLFETAPPRYAVTYSFPSYSDMQMSAIKK